MLNASSGGYLHNFVYLGKYHMHARTHSWFFRHFVDIILVGLCVCVCSVIAHVCMQTNF